VQNLGNLDSFRHSRFRYTPVKTGRQDKPQGAAGRQKVWSLPGIKARGNQFGELGEFSAHYGRNGDMHFLSRVRIESSKGLLINLQLRVSEVAYGAGFQSLTHFNRVFQKILGQSPTEYRLKVQNRRRLT
jgi:hypothetical protein